jgi:hypothetical protein
MKRDSDLRRKDVRAYALVVLLVIGSVSLSLPRLLKHWSMRNGTPKDKTLRQSR